jgi:hypothetical protein
MESFKARAETLKSTAELKLPFQVDKKDFFCFTTPQADENIPASPQLHMFHECNTNAGIYASSRSW